MTIHNLDKQHFASLSSNDPKIFNENCGIVS
jgi:hypothetical protein